MNRNKDDVILAMLKALSDESRLKLIRILNDGEQTVGELAGLLNLSEPTISHHLSRLRENGFVTLRMAGNQRFYCVNETGLARFKQLALEIEMNPPKQEPIISNDAWILSMGWSKEDQKVLYEYTENGQLTHLPTKQKKTQVILRWLATLFTSGRMYTELEINEIIKQVYAEDYISLRRDLIDMGYLRRERGGGKYWLAPVDEDVSPQTKG
jgi:hypothetical protein